MPRPPSSTLFPYTTLFRSQLRPNLTITAGVRYSLYSPPYEVNGFQVAPTVSMGQWFDERMQNMQNGIPSSASPLVQFDLAGDRKSTRLNSSHGYISYAVFC